MRGGFSVLAVLLIGVLLGGCLTALAEAAYPTSHECAAVKADEVSPSKTSSPNLWVVPVAYSIVPPELLQSRCAPLDRTPLPVSANLWGDRFSRAPPALQ